MYRLSGGGVKALIDLGRVLWAPDDPANEGGNWHLARSDDPGGDYVARWNFWVAANRDVLNGSYVLTFKVIDEPSLRGIQQQDVDTAARLVKSTFMIP